MAKLMFKLPWGKAILHTVRVVGGNALVPVFKGNPDIFAAAFMKKHTPSGASALVDNIVNATSTPDTFWKRVKEIVDARTKRDAAAKLAKPA